MEHHGLGSRALQPREHGRRLGPMRETRCCFGRGQKEKGWDHHRNITALARSLRWQDTSCTGHKWLGQTATGISDSRGGHGPPPLGLHEQAPPMVPVTSGFAAKKGTTTEHHLLASLPWESCCHCQRLGHCLHLPEGHCHFPGPCNKEQPTPPPSGSLPLSRD